VIVVLAGAAAGVVLVAGLALLALDGIMRAVARLVA
jgi:hypothetical protein